MHRQIWVKFTKRGIHKYPAAKDDPGLDDVSYLGDPHHHFFEFKVGISVVHNDRDIEFHQFLNWLESLYEGGTIHIDYKSCEMLAEDLIEYIQDKYPGRSVTVDVSEDGYVGATLSA